MGMVREVERRKGKSVHSEGGICRPIAFCVIGDEVYGLGSVESAAMCVVGGGDWKDRGDDVKWRSLLLGILTRV